MLARRLSALIRRVTAPNPSPMTGPGTNTYLVGTGEVTVIDPGPDDPRHIEAIMAALGRERVSRILLTHSHPDHAPGAAHLARATGASVLAYPLTLHDGEVLVRGSATVEVIHTPGHASDHVCFFLREEQALFSGDLIMSGSTVVIAPPDGDMAAYLRSLERLRQRAIARIYPGHGEPLDEPAAVIAEYLAHRRMREQQILEALRQGPARIPDLVSRIYTDVPPSLHPLAARSVYAHLLKLRAEGRVDGSDLLSQWRLI
ncbi:MAG: MBL fold metallo-hydrolase [Armatimonadota bacterium]|nr:MBL fold metallo-hydrolase [Armatimonadota bacterium]